MAYVKETQTCTSFKIDRNDSRQTSKNWLETYVADNLDTNFVETDSFMCIFVVNLKYARILIAEQQNKEFQQVKLLSICAGIPFDAIDLICDV